MKIAVWPAGDDACAKYRLLLPAQAVMNEGVDVNVDYNCALVRWSQPLGAGQIPGPDHHITSMMPYDADVVVVQRPTHRMVYEIIPFLQKQGTRVVVDVDDRFDQVSPRNSAFNAFNPLVAPHSNHTWISKACQIADVVTATTPALVERFGYGHGVVVPNMVPESYLSMESEQTPKTIGWAGALETHPDDLPVVGNGVQMACDATGARFVVVGPGAGVQECLRLKKEPEATGWVSADEYIEQMAKFSVGIVPLTDSVFNKAKSALKMCEMAAVGVPVVASPTPDNMRINSLGVGVIARTPQKWNKALRSIINNEEYRLELAETGREAMKSQTYERNAHLWAEVWCK